MRQVTPADPTYGILDFRHGLDHFGLERLPPAAELRPWIEGYWIVTWDLPAGQGHRQTNVSHASINAACEPEGAFLYGVPGRTFVREISGRGRVFGVKFRPGGFFPYYGAPLSRLAGTRIPLEEAFGESGRRWARAVTAAGSNEERGAITDAFWRARRPADDVRPATLVAERIISDRTVLTAAQAAERLLRDRDLACGELAHELGYFDQAHFVRDFKAVVGVAPDVYRRRQ